MKFRLAIGNCERNNYVDGDKHTSVYIDDCVKEIGDKLDVVRLDAYRTEPYAYLADDGLPVVGFRQVETDEFIKFKATGTQHAQRNNLHWVRIIDQVQYYLEVDTLDDLKRIFDNDEIHIDFVDMRITVTQ